MGDNRKLSLLSDPIDNNSFLTNLQTKFLPLYRLHIRYIGVMLPFDDIDFFVEYFQLGQMFALRQRKKTSIVDGNNDPIM